MSLCNTDCVPIPVAMQFAVYVCSCMVAGIMGLNPTEGTNVWCLSLAFLVCSVGSSLCNQLTTCSEETYKEVHVCACV